MAVTQIHVGMRILRITHRHTHTVFCILILKLFFKEHRQVQVKTSTQRTSREKTWKRGSGRNRTRATRPAGRAVRRAASAVSPGPAAGQLMVTGAGATLLRAWEKREGHLPALQQRMPAKMWGREASQTRLVHY